MKLKIKKKYQLFFLNIKKELLINANIKKILKAQIYSHNPKKMKKIIILKH